MHDTDIKKPDVNGILNTDVKKDVEKRTLMDIMLQGIADRLIEIFFDPSHRTKLLEILDQVEEAYSKYTDSKWINFVLAPVRARKRQRDVHIAEFSHQVREINKQETESKKLNESLALLQAESNKKLQDALADFFLRGAWEKSSANTSFAAFLIKMATDTKYEDLLPYSDKPETIVRRLCEIMIEKAPEYVQQNIAATQKTYDEKKHLQQKLAETRARGQELKEAEAAKKLDETLPENFDFQRKRKVVNFIAAIRKSYNAPPQKSYKEKTELNDVANSLETLITKGPSAAALKLQRESRKESSYQLFLKKLKNTTGTKLEQKIEEKSEEFQSNRKAVQALLLKPSHTRIRKERKNAAKVAEQISNEFKANKKKIEALFLEPSHIKVRNQREALAKAEGEFVDINDFVGEGHDFHTKPPVEPILTVPYYDANTKLNSALLLTPLVPTGATPVIKTITRDVSRLASLSSSAPLFGIKREQLQQLNEEINKSEQNLSQSENLNVLKRS